MHYCAGLYIEDVHTSVYLFHVKDNPNLKLQKEHYILLYITVLFKSGSNSTCDSTSLKNKTNFHFSFVIAFFFYVRVVPETIFEKA